MNQPYDFTDCLPPEFPPDLVERVSAFLNDQIGEQELQPPFWLVIFKEGSAWDCTIAELDSVDEMWCPRCKVVHSHLLRIVRFVSEARLLVTPFGIGISAGRQFAVPLKAYQITAADGPAHH